MAIAPYLAMTPGEMMYRLPLSARVGWMACHFSSSGTGLSNLPASLPPEALLILDDSTPMNGHDPAQIAGQLEACASKHGCPAILLDFQRPGQPQAEALVSFLMQALSLPVIAAKDYARHCGGVFLPPVPADVPLREYLAPWQGRDIWLEAALDALEITLTEQGAAAVPLSGREAREEKGFSDSRLHCHYRCKVQENTAVFTLWRSPGDLSSLLEEAATLGVTAAVGLYQELFPYLS